MNEYELIRKMCGKFPRSGKQRNAPFECDAEIVEIGKQLWALTLDDFSPEEDLFSYDDPAMLGANLVTATLSDLFACGAEPRFFMHALSLSKKTSEQFIDGLVSGISSALKEAGCCLCGGDVGTADPWRYCGFAMGPITAAKPLTRVLPMKPQTLWVTGRLGDANLAAFQKAATPRFELRVKDAALIRERATGCIDTSGGLCDALWLLHEQNTKLRFDVHCERIPMADGIREFSKATGVPAEAALLGGAGEYELLFAANDGLSGAKADRMHETGATHIGQITVDAQPGVYFHRHDAPESQMKQPPPCPREAVTIEDHAQAVVKMAKDLFGGGNGR